MPKPNPKTNKKRTFWITAIVATPFLIIFLFGLFALQVPQYSYYYVKCGFKEPVKIENNSSQSFEYILPDDAGYKSAALFVVDYFCSEQGAKEAGYRHAKF